MPEDIDLFENGGLNDEDADAARPTLKAQRFIQFAPKDRERVGEYPERDPLRRNNVCGIVTCSFVTPPDSLLQLAGIVDNNSDVEVQVLVQIENNASLINTF